MHRELTPESCHDGRGGTPHPPLFNNQVQFLLMAMVHLVQQMGSICKNARELDLNYRFKGAVVVSLVMNLVLGF